MKAKQYAKAIKKYLPIVLAGYSVGQQPRSRKQVKQLGRA